MLSSKVSRAGLSTPAVRSHLRRLLYGVFVLALVALAAALAAAAVPRLLGYHTLVVRGGSMNDSIPSGSLVTARWLTAEDVALGDVIVVQEEGEDGPSRPKIHRVVSLDEENGRILAQTKGDANDSVDPKLYVLPDRVLTPAYTLPYIGYVAAFATTVLGWVVLVALPATALCLYTLRAIWAPRQETAAEPPGS